MQVGTIVLNGMDLFYVRGTNFQHIPVKLAVDSEGNVKAIPYYESPGPGISPQPPATFKPTNVNKAASANETSEAEIRKIEEDTEQ